MTPTGTLRGRSTAAADGLAGAVDRRPILLIADDDEDLLEQAAQMFDDAGYQVRTASHGGKAIEALEDGLIPDAIVLDLLMPVKNGWDVCDWLQQSRFAHVPVVVWTASGQRQGAVGRVRVIAKGDDPQALVEAIDAALVPAAPPTATDP